MQITIDIPDNSSLERTVSLNDEKARELLTEIMIDLIKAHRGLLHEVILEVLEEVGLANAMSEGRKNDFVSEEDIFSILNGG